MNIRLSVAVLFLLAAVGCDSDSTVTPTPTPKTALTLDEQVIANCEVLRDSLEAYASRHDGYYPEGRDFGTALNIDLINPYTEMREEIVARARFRGQTAYEPYMACDGSILIAGYRITGYGLDHQLVQFENLDRVSANARWVHDIIAANADLVLSAALTWTESNGRYPADLSDGGLDGKTLIDLLPGGRNLINPVTGSPDQPIDGYGSEPGAVGYVGVGGADGARMSCVVDAMGCDYTFSDQLVLVPEPDYDWGIRFNSHYVREAVEEFAKDAGAYPHNVDTDQTPSGKTVIDLLNYPLKDPYTHQLSPPINGTATTRGQVGYAPVIENDVATGYVITGYGLFGEIVRLGPEP